MSGDDPIDFSEWQAKGTGRKRKSTTPPAEPEADLSELRDAAKETRLDRKTVEEIAELALRRTANVYLLGGDAMLPKNPTEAANVAKAWASIRATEKFKSGEGLTEIEEATKQARAALHLMRERARKKAE